MPPDTGPVSAAYPPYYAPSSSSGGTFVPARSLNCRLPVYAGPIGTTTIKPGAGGFLVFPGGTFVADPASDISSPYASPSPNTPVPSPPGFEYLWPAITYDRAYSKWLPVPSAWVSPDESRYAYPSGSSVVVRNLADGTTIYVGEGRAWSILAVLADGVYASAPGSAGLWQLPYSGSPRQVAATGHWLVASTGAAYGTRELIDPYSASTNGIVKLDLITGAITDWFVRGNSQATAVGLDGSGHPIVQLNYFLTVSGHLYGWGPELWVITAQSIGVPIGGSGIGYSSRTLINQDVPLGDSHGIWFPGALVTTRTGLLEPSQTTFLYVPGEGLFGMSRTALHVVGPCV